MSSIGILRYIAAHELELMRDWRNAPEVQRYMYTRHEISREEHLAWWTRSSQSEQQSYLMYEAGGEPLGIVGFSEIDQINRRASWAFYASPTAPRGTGSRMEYLALDHAFLDLGLNRLHCEVLVTNPAVIKLHQKFGFSLEGIFRQDHLLDSEFIDVYHFGILAAEWAKKRDAMIKKITRN